MSGVLKNRKKREDAEAAALAAALTATAGSTISSMDDENEKGKEGDGAKGKRVPVSRGGNKKRRRDSDDDEDEFEEQNKNAELRITASGAIEGEDGTSDEGEMEGDAVGLTASGKPRQKKFIKRRLRRYLSLEDKIAVFERIVKDIDPKTKKLRYGASNEICGEYSIGRKTINNIKNLFEGLIREGKDLSTILSAETMADIPSKLNVDLSAATQPLNSDLLMAGEDGDYESAKKQLEAVKQNLQLSFATNAASVSVGAEESSDSEKDNEGGSKLKLRLGGTSSTIPDSGDERRFKPLYDDETRMRKLLKVNNVGRQTKLNDLTIERIRAIAPYCSGVKHLSEKFAEQFGEKIHQSTLWRYCTELNIKIPKKIMKK